MGRNQHVVPRPDGNWGVKGEGNDRSSSVRPTQQGAIRDAVRIARHERSEVVIHGRDGKIRDKDSYGSDPNPPKDTRH